MDRYEQGDRIEIYAQGPGEKKAYDRNFYGREKMYRYNLHLRLFVWSYLANVDSHKRETR